MMECKKCNSSGSVLLRKKDSYCGQCFIANINHKFRSCIGKNRVLSSNERVLLGISGGIGSAVLLDLVNDGVTLKSHKILRISPICVHVTGLLRNPQNEIDLANEVIKKCNDYGFDVYVVHSNNYYQEEFTLPEKNCFPTTKSETIEELHINWDKLSSTARNDLIIKIRRNLFIKIGTLLQCSYVFTAETTTTLASNLLSNLALGRGSQIEHDVGFSDFRDDGVRILRPMKDISKEELDKYAVIKSITSIDKHENYSESLQTLIKSFVVDLQDNFSATISTVCKTSDKIGSYEHELIRRKCKICQSDINMKNSKLTALEATIFSKVVCFSHPEQQASQLLNAQNFNNTLHENFDSCYACSRHF